LFRYIFFVSIFITSLYSYDLRGNFVKESVWKYKETFLSFLQENGMPLDLYYKLDSEDEKLLMDIKMATLYQVVVDKDGKARDILLPVSDELQLYISRDQNGSFSLKMIPIIYETKQRVLSLKFEDIPSKDITKKSGNFELSLEVENIFRNVVNFKKIQKGDRLVVFYQERKRLGRTFGRQKIEAAMIEQGGKKFYKFLGADGRYYDQNAKTNDKSSFIVPCKYKRISSIFTNKRWHPILHRYRAHHGIDYATPVGTPVKAAYNGKVIFAGVKGGYGNCVVIKHSGGYQSIYGHLSKIKCYVGKRVKIGEIIALSGNTGRSTGPHLHFGISLNGTWINPALKIVFVKGLSGKKRVDFLKYSKYYMKKIENVLRSQHKVSSKIKDIEDNIGG